MTDVRRGLAAAAVVAVAVAVGAWRRRRITPQNRSELAERDARQRAAVVAWTWPPLGLLFIGVGLAALFGGRGWFPLVVIAFGVFFLWAGVWTYRARRR